METHYFDCQCSNLGHVVRFTVDMEDGTIYLDYFINHYESWFVRLKKAIKYFFSGYCQYQYDVTVFKEDDHFRLKDILNKSDLAKAAAITRSKMHANLNNK